MKFLNRRYFYILAGLFFVIAASFHTVYHEYSYDASIIDCQFCNNKASDLIHLNTSISKVFQPIFAKVDITENFVSLNPRSYYSRAPPAAS